MAISAANLVIAAISLVAAIIYSNQSQLFIQKLNELVHWKPGCNPIRNVGNVSLHYFGMRGKAEAIRLILEDNRVNYRDVIVTTDTWAELKQLGIESGLFVFGQVPAIETSKGFRLVQSQAIVHFLGRSLGLDCDCRDLEWCDVIAAGVADVNEKRARLMYNPNRTVQLRAEFVNVTLPTWLSYFENFAPTRITESDGLYFASDRLTWIDYLVFDMLESTLAFIDATSSTKDSDLEDIMLGNFPRLNSFYKYFCSRKNIFQYLNRDNRFPFYLPYPNITENT